MNEKKREVKHPALTPSKYNDEHDYCSDPVGKILLTYELQRFVETMNLLVTDYRSVDEGPYIKQIDRCMVVVQALRTAIGLKESGSGSDIKVRLAQELLNLDLDPITGLLKELHRRMDADAMKIVADLLEKQGFILQADELRPKKQSPEKPMH